MTDEQRKALKSLCDRWGGEGRGVPFDESHYGPQFDLPPGLRRGVDRRRPEPARGHLRWLLTRRQDFVVTAPGATENGSVLMRVVGLAGYVVDPAGALAADLVATLNAQTVYVYSYDPEAFDGRGDIAYTIDPAKAARWPSTSEALRAWRTAPANRPVRADGKPNTPLTALTVEILSVEEVVPDAVTCHGCGGVHLDDDRRECAHGTFSALCYVDWHHGQDFCPSVDER